MSSDGGIRHDFTFVGGGKISTVGGIVRTITEIANHLSRQGHTVRYLAKLRPGEKPFYDLDKEVILEAVEYPHSSSQIKAFSNRLKKLDTDALIIALSGKHTLNIMKAAEGLPFPVVRSEHGDPEKLLQTVWNNDGLARSATFQLADYTHLLFSEFATSPDLGDAVRETMHFIPSPVALDVQQATPAKADENGKMKIVSVGRIEEFEKNTGLLLKAFFELAEDFPNWECHFVGDGSQVSQLKEISNRHECSGQVFFHDSVKGNALSKHYSTGNLFVIPSDSEGCPMALGEALAHGLPAIGFADCTGVNKMILNEENGLLTGDIKTPSGLSDASNANILTYEPVKQPPLIRDDLPEVDKEQRLNQLVSAMRFLMGRPELLKKYGSKAPSTVVDYESISILNQWSDFLCKVASETGDIKQYRQARLEKYPELAQASQNASKAITRLSSPNYRKSFRDILPFSMLYENRKLNI